MSGIQPAGRVRTCSGGDGGQPGGQLAGQLGAARGSARRRRSRGCGRAPSRPAAAAAPRCGPAPGAARRRRRRRSRPGRSPRRPRPSTRSAGTPAGWCTWVVSSVGVADVERVAEQADVAALRDGDAVVVHQPALQPRGVALAEQLGQQHGAAGSCRSRRPGRAPASRGRGPAPGRARSSTHRRARRGRRGSPIAGAVGDRPGGDRRRTSAGPAARSRRRRGRRRCTGRRCPGRSSGRRSRVASVDGGGLQVDEGRRSRRGCWRSSRTAICGSCSQGKAP